MIRALTIAASASITAVLCAVMFVACVDDPPRGWPPDDIGDLIGDCCNGLVLPLIFDDPQTCIEERTNLDALQDTQCRWINCLGGIVTYWLCNCGGEPRDERCS